MYKLFLILSIFIISCNTETIYSGKILNQENIDNLNFKNKETLLKELGEPSFYDPIGNQFVYFSEKKNKNSIFKTKIEYSYLFVFDFDKNNNVKNTKVYDLKNKNSIDNIDDITDSEVIKRGLIERIFGGVGPQQELPTTP
tara:strand:+ start:2154 stop:2576 length:423 start_codon:yes stop_codon:yes gene_type:complete